MFARGLSNKSRGTGLGRAGQKSAERTTITLEVPDWLTEKLSGW